MIRGGYVMVSPGTLICTTPLNEPVFVSVQHLCISKFDVSKKKMAIILPTGQWYAPSEVINEAL